MNTFSIYILYIMSLPDHPWGGPFFWPSQTSLFNTCFFFVGGGVKRAHFFHSQDNWNQYVNMDVYPLRRAIISSVCYGEENQYDHHNAVAQSQQLSSVRRSRWLSIWCHLISSAWTETLWDYNKVKCSERETRPLIFTLCQKKKKNIFSESG